MCKVYFIYVTKKICYFMFYMEQTMPTKRCRLCTNRDAVFEMWKITLLDYHLFKRDIFTASVSWQSPIRIRSPWFPKIPRIWEREVVSLETKKKKKKLTFWNVHQKFYSPFRFSCAFLQQCSSLLSCQLHQTQTKDRSLLFVT